MIQAICWGLIHSLWQGLLLAIAAGCVIFCTKRSTAAVRYRWLCSLFFLFLAGGGLTFFYELYRAEESGVVAGSGFYPLAANVFLVQVDGLGQYCSAHALQIVSVWFIFFSVKSVRLAAGWGYMRHLRRDSAIGAPTKWVERVKLLGGQLGIRQTIKLVESGLVRVPIVIGQLRPIIFIPLGLINQLPAGEMEAVLLHELAHIQRFDYVVNFIQQIAECLFFFNPGLLWISSLLREERENCCDDIAIERTRDRVEFVRALVRFKEYSLQGSTVLAFPARKRQLLHRVLRISQQQNKTLNGGERFFLLGSCLVLALLLVSLHRKVGLKGGGGDLAARVEMQEADVRAGGPIVVEAGSRDLIAVLQTREQVAKNLQWVEQQLNRLHHKVGMRRAGRRQVKRETGPKVGDQLADRDREQELKDQEQGRLNGLQDQLNRELSQRNEDQLQQNQQVVALESQRQQAARDQEQARLDRVQAERDREQAVRDREQAQRDRDQAIKDGHQADLDLMQAEKDRMQADKGREQAVKDRELASKEREQAEMKRTQAEVNRLQGEKNQPAEKRRE